ncbi:MAG: hypothetical protein JWO90_2838, partial [Solirubrobacterales bacterium]|nr:hypothetical protein [Solirubrobacterales bacterium]
RPATPATPQQEFGPAPTEFPGG